MKYASTDFTRLITTKSITIGFEGETKTFKKEHPTYQKLLEAIREERWDDLPDLLTPEKKISTMSDGEMRVENGQVKVKTPDGEFEVPSDLNKTILFYMENQLPFKPLVKFAINLSQNPSYRSVQQLFKFLEHNSFTITEEGKFIAYKGVTKDFKDCRTQTIDNSVGVVVKMPRNQVDEDPEHSCSTGLHAANFSVSKQYWGSGPDKIHLYVEVNPKDVVAVPYDYNCAKMRVCEYKVLGIAKQEFTDPIYIDPNSNYDSSEEDDNYEDEDEDDEYCDDCGQYKY